MMWIDGEYRSISEVEDEIDLLEQILARQEGKPQEQIRQENHDILFRRKDG